MPSLYSRLALVSAAAILTPVGVGAQAPDFVRAPAKNEAPARVEAAMFDLDANLADAGKLSNLLIQSGVAPAEAQSAAALAATQVADDVPVRTRIGLSRNPDSGALSVQRLTVSTASMQVVMEQRSGTLRVVSTAARKLRTV